MFKKIAFAIISNTIDNALTLHLGRSLHDSRYFHACIKFYHDRG
ncbi:hypothetical protein CY0110_16777 [Crocosphaera chwakensis CCY0110]|uniref:Uncharacterized protein n=1 Tax=Crocosphaera chwakensis CCY0110 TaxID=391612 RepID=A3II37_9CHRO|nr:hypothetical protein CY0110_16777 [Crocosphaera chwakensis CCY0110]